MFQGAYKGTPTVPMCTGCYAVCAQMEIHGKARYDRMSADYTNAQNLSYKPHGQRIQFAFWSDIWHYEAGMVYAVCQHRVI